MKNSPNHFDNTYSLWKNWHENEFGKLSKSNHNYFNAELKRTKRSHVNVLEIGYGNGQFLAYAKSQGWNITGTEVNETLIGVAKEHQFDVVQTDDLECFSDNSFDLVVAFSVLEHIDRNRIQDFIKQIARILQHEGIFLAVFPNGDSPFGLINQNGDITHVSFIGRGKVNYLSRLINAEVLFCKGTAQPLFEGTLVGFIHRLLTKPIKIVIGLILKIVFHPKANIDFLSIDTTMVLKINKKNPKN